MNNQTPTMLGVKETAETFGISAHYARQLALSGQVKAVRVGRGKILINAQSVADFFNMLNFHATFTKSTIEFRLFQFDKPTAEKKNGLHAGQLKSYIQLCLALS